MTTSATGGASDGPVGTQREGHRATPLRPRQLVGRDCEIVEVIERIALTPLTTVTGPGGVANQSTLYVRWLKARSDDGRRTSTTRCRWTDLPRSSQGNRLILANQILASGADHRRKASFDMGCLAGDLGLNTVSHNARAIAAERCPQGGSVGHLTGSSAAILARCHVPGVVQADAGSPSAVRRWPHHTDSDSG